MSISFSRDTGAQRPDDRFLKI